MIHEKEDVKELVDALTEMEARQEELIENIQELRKAYLEVCKKHGEEANSCVPYMNSLKY